jgi:hypothetical protein
VAECAQPVEIQAAAEPSARVGFEPGDLIGDECHVGRLVDADLGASLEHGVGRSGLRAERAATAAGFIGTTRPSSNTVTADSYVWFTPTTT